MKHQTCRCGCVCQLYGPKCNGTVYPVDADALVLIHLCEFHHAHPVTPARKRKKKAPTDSKGDGR